MKKFIFVERFNTLTKRELVGKNCIGENIVPNDKNSSETMIVGENLPDNFEDLKNLKLSQLVQKEKALQAELIKLNLEYRKLVDLKEEDIPVWEFKPDPSLMG